MKSPVNAALPHKDRHLLAKALAIAIVKLGQDSHQGEKNWQALEMKRILRSLVESDKEFDWFLTSAEQIGDAGDGSAQAALADASSTALELLKNNVDPA